MREIATLVRENGGSGIINLGKDVTNSASMELLRIEGFKRMALGLVDRTFLQV